MPVCPLSLGCHKCGCAAGPRKHASYCTLDDSSQALSYIQLHIASTSTFIPYSFYSCVVQQQ